MLDDKTPHVACVVQAVVDSRDKNNEKIVVAGALADESGKHQLDDERLESKDGISCSKQFNLGHSGQQDSRPKIRCATTSVKFLVDSFKSFLFSFFCNCAILT